MNRLAQISEYLPSPSRSTIPHTRKGLSLFLPYILAHLGVIMNFEVAHHMMARLWHHSLYTLSQSHMLDSHSI
ncbi:uncharacterized protein LAJ45_08988 [Morchella importuna]|uniref:uncharacterized protein n=1 Tax=Morchella importuna TaxID=1174673 RepID=UPI001E8EAFBA|nr:uncharacterized protein LAJ45_08988 [Morchella importuna]KAH8146909.1 hypothetical protein LAJ45_08988 [Morchella importuna]